MRTYSLVAAFALLAALPVFADPIDISAGFGGTTKLALDLGTKRTNWTNAQWAVLKPAQALALSGARALRITVATEEPRSDTGVYLALQEASGAWYYVPWAANLTKKTNIGDGSFGDFTHADYISPPGDRMDPNGRLDRDSITAIAVGVVNPFGVGKVSFTVQSLETLPTVPAEKGPPTPITVTGRFMDINGTQFIPAGVFGQFYLKTIPGATEKLRLAQDRRIASPGEVTLPSGSTSLFINTWGDRSVPSPRVTDANWAANLDKAARAAGQKAKDAGKQLTIEWWNEPYLNWSNKNRLAYDPGFFDQANRTEGGPVKLKDGTIAPHLKWTQNYDAPGFNWASPRYTKTADGLERDNWRRGKDAKGQMYSDYFVPPSWAAKRSKYNPSFHPPRTVADGQKYTVQVKSGKKGDEKSEGVELTAFTPWYVYDQTQFTYWSAQGAGVFYNEPLVAVGKALKESNPSATLVAGWGFRPSEDHWAGFRLAYQPTIDAAAAYIDGICDHDYGGSPIKMPASYETMTAYGMSKHSKWLYAYNTETAASYDPQAVAVSEGGSGEATADRLKLEWASRKLTHMLAMSPDKVRSQSWFGSDKAFVSEQGEGNALLLLRNLRGRLVQVESGDPLTYAIASVDGTDPTCPRPADMPQRKELVVALLNDRLEAAPVSVTITAPTGTQFAGLAIRTPKLDDPKDSPTVSTREEQATGSTYTYRATLPSRVLTVLTFPLTGEPNDKAEVTRRQYFGGDILTEVTPKAAVAQKVKIDAGQLAGAKRAWVQFVAERLADGEGVVSLNGRKYTLPSAVTPENAAYVRTLPIAVEDLKELNELVFSVTTDEHAGYLLAMASVFVEK